MRVNPTQCPFEIEKLQILILVLTFEMLNLLNVDLFSFGFIDYLFKTLHLAMLTMKEL